MAKRSRRIKSSGSKSLTSWPRVLLIIVPLFAAVLIMFNSQNGRSVLGVKDSNLFGLRENVKSSQGSNSISKSSCNRVTNFSAVTICEATSEKTNNAFQSYNYTCEDGTSGSVEQKEGKCIPLSKAYELARKACNQKCRPMKTPTPSPTAVTTE